MAMSGADDDKAENPPPHLRSRLHQVRYAEADYWDQRYRTQTCEFDWFYGYVALRRLVRKIVRRSRLVLHVGCGNSNFQEGMAKDGYQVVNSDISSVVIEQMRAKHSHLAALRYVVSDCRCMPEMLDCQFGSVIDKGTVDALLCSKDAGDSLRRMFSECSRVLMPGGVFLLITLGAPAQRLALVNQPEFGWDVQVCLVRRVPEAQLASDPGRAIPLNDTARPLPFIGPLPVRPDGTVEGLPAPFVPSDYFFAYVCRKHPLVLPADNSSASRQSAVRLPEGWRAAVRAVAESVGSELRLPQGILGRGKRVAVMSRASFERNQLRKELEQEQQRRQQQQGAAALAAAVAGAGSPASSLQVPCTTDDVPCCAGTSSVCRSSGRGSSCKGSSGLDCVSGDSASGVSSHVGGGGEEGGGGGYLAGSANSNVIDEPDTSIPDSDHLSSEGLAAATGAWTGTAVLAVTSPGGRHEHPHGQGQAQGTYGRGKVRVVSFSAHESESEAKLLQPPDAGAGGASARAGCEGGGDGGVEGEGGAAGGLSGWQGGGGRAVSYGRLSASVQDAFAHLDVVDGEGGCGSSPCADRSNSGRTARHASWELEAAAVVAAAAVGAAARGEQRLAGMDGAGGNV